MSNVVAFPTPDEDVRDTSVAAAPAYAELAVTTNFSFLRGASHPEELVRQAAALGLAGLGIADRNSVAGVVRAYGAAEELNREIRRLNREHGTHAPELKLLVGARLVFADGTPDISPIRKTAPPGAASRACSPSARAAARKPNASCISTTSSSTSPASTSS